MNNQAKWDDRFISICDTIASWSSCLSRKIGSIVVKDKTILATGYNGPPRGVAHCGKERNTKDAYLFKALASTSLKLGDDTVCPRYRMDLKSGEGLGYCIATHAEQNCIANAARTGTCLDGGILYINTVIPCKNCMGLIINAGIVEVVTLKTEYYDEQTKYLVEQSKIKVRRVR